MDAEIVTTIVGTAALIVAFWIMASHFDRRNQSRFEKLQEHIARWQSDLQREIEKAADRRLIGK